MFPSANTPVVRVEARRSRGPQIADPEKMTWSRPRAKGSVECAGSVLFASSTRKTQLIPRLPSPPSPGSDSDVVPTLWIFRPVVFPSGFSKRNERKIGMDGILRRDGHLAVAGILGCLLAKHRPPRSRPMACCLSCEHALRPAFRKMEIDEVSRNLVLEPININQPRLLVGHVVDALFFVFPRGSLV